MKKILVLITILFGTSSYAQEVENLIIITTDGLRWQELFGGVDTFLIKNSKYTKNRKGLSEKYGSKNPEVSRSLIFPFIWSEIVTHGSIFGNRNIGSKANIKNKYGFSYPGYNEILTGYADRSVNSNSKIYNENVTVLEYLNQQDSFKNKIAAFGTWDVFPYIINDKRSLIPVNAGKTQLEGNLSESQILLNEMLSLYPSHASDRHDFVTYFMAKEYLKKHEPKVLYIALDETDEFAHEGNYDEYLHAAHNFDTFVKDIWKYLETNPKYKNKTALILTTDHGRGNINKDQWTSHGQQVKDCDEIWMAFMGPNIKNLGEVQNNNEVYQNQIAATLAKILGQDFSPKPEAGKPIIDIFK